MTHRHFTERELVLGVMAAIVHNKGSVIADLMAWFDTAWLVEDK